MQQIVDFTEELEETIKALEEECIEITGRLEQCYRPVFEKYGQKILIDVVRTKKGREISTSDVFAEDYESFVEIALVEDEEYFPNAYIPIWKCKKELFSLIGYLTKWDSKMIEKKIKHILLDMLQERLEDLKDISCL